MLAAPCGKHNLHLGTVPLATMGCSQRQPTSWPRHLFGPITDNAGKATIEIAARPIRFVKHDELDAARNTKRTKGYATARPRSRPSCSSAAYLESVHDMVAHYFAAAGEVLAGRLAVLPHTYKYHHLRLCWGDARLPLHLSLHLRVGIAVGRRSIQERRRQFRQLQDMEGTSTPDYGRCVDISDWCAARGNDRCPAPLPVRCRWHVSKVMAKTGALAQYSAAARSSGKSMNFRRRSSATLNSGAVCWPC